jgi:hypothetical protein
VLAVSLTATAAFSASFSISVSASLAVVEGPVTNTFAYGVVAGSQTNTTGGSGNGYGNANPNRNYISQGYSAGATFFGNADPDPDYSSTATATGGKSGQINLANISGDPGMAPATYFLAHLTWTYSYSITLVTAASETASGSIGIKIDGNPVVGPISYSATEGETQVFSNSGSTTYSINMPAGYSVSQSIQVGATGSASALMQAVPEPASLLVMGLPLGYIVRRRRAGSR